jgi:hypothetical protein
VLQAADGVPLLVGQVHDLMIRAPVRWLEVTVSSM